MVVSTVMLDFSGIARYRSPSIKNEDARALGVPPEADQVSGVRKKKNQEVKPET
jgi:hypothetical protein